MDGSTMLNVPHEAVEQNVTREIRGFDKDALSAVFEAGLNITGMRVERDERGEYAVYEVGEPSVTEIVEKDTAIGAHFSPEAQSTFFEAGYKGVGLSESTLCGGQTLSWMEMVR